MKFIRPTFIALFALASIAPTFACSTDHPPVPAPPMPLSEENIASDSQVNISAGEKNPLVVELEKATEGVLMPSETDAPFSVFFWDIADEKLSPEHIAARAKLDSPTPVEMRSLEDLLGELSEEADWMDEGQKETAKKLKNLREVLEKNLKNVEVYLFGETKKNVVIIGKVETGFAGVITIVVET